MYPAGHVFFDGPNKVAWRVFPSATKTPVVQVYSMLPRCVLPGIIAGSSACGVGLCSIPVPGVLLGVSCECPAAYGGDAVLSDRPWLNKYCSTCTTGAVNSNPDLRHCTSCPPGFWSNQTYASMDQTKRPTPPYGVGDTPHCIPCGVGRVGPSVMSPKESGCLNCPAGRKNALTTATTIDECLNCGVGLYSEAGSEVCTTCPLGRIQELEGQANCLGCLPGKHQTVHGSNVCDFCMKGKYTATAGVSVACTSCNAGKYQDQDGQALVSIPLFQDFCSFSFSFCPCCIVNIVLATYIYSFVHS